MTRRTYVPTLLGIAHRMCAVLLVATPVITKLYPTNTALLAALDAANAACATLGLELQAVRETET